MLLHRLEHRRVVPAIVIAALMLGCMSTPIYRVTMKNDSTQNVSATATFNNGEGTLDVPARGSVDFHSRDPFTVEVSLPDGTRRVVRASGRGETPNIRIVEGQLPYTIYVNGR